MVDPARSGHPDDTLAAYALGVLEPRDAEVVAAHVRACPQCLADVRRLRALLGPVPPPPSAQQALWRRIDGPASHASVAPGRESERSRFGRGVPAAIARALDEVADGVVVVGPEGQVLFANAAARRLLGVRNSEELAAMNAPGARFGAASGAEPSPLPTTVGAGEMVAEVRWMIRRPDGSEVIAAGSVCPLTLPDGTHYGSALVFRRAASRALEP